MPAEPFAKRSQNVRNLNLAYLPARGSAASSPRPGFPADECRRTQIYSFIRALRNPVSQWISASPPPAAGTRRPSAKRGLLADRLEIGVGLEADDVGEAAGLGLAKAVDRPISIIPDKGFRSRASGRPSPAAVAGRILIAHRPRRQRETAGGLEINHLVRRGLGHQSPARWPRRGRARRIAPAPPSRNARYLGLGIGRQLLADLQAAAIGGHSAAPVARLQRARRLVVERRGQPLESLGVRRLGR